MLRANQFSFFNYTNLWSFMVDFKRSISISRKIRCTIIKWKSFIKQRVIANMSHWWRFGYVENSDEILILNQNNTLKVNTLKLKIKRMHSMQPQWKSYHSKGFISLQNVFRRNLHNYEKLNQINLQTFGGSKLIFLYLSSLLFRDKIRRTRTHTHTCVMGDCHFICFTQHNRLSI